MGNSVFKLLIAAVVVFAIWKFGLPFLNKQKAENAAPHAGTSPGTTCVFEARGASDFFGANVRAFSNPPYDVQVWDEFRSHVDERISRTQQKCSCSDDACKNGLVAMNELQGMVSDMDSMIRSGSAPPSDLVQRQERLDNALDAARNAADK